ncbi:MAG: DNA topoisomerase IV subunit A, partial [Alphaproteobacteria bacterium]
VMLPLATAPGAETLPEMTLAEEASLIAATKTGKQVVTLKEYEKVAVCRPVDGDHVGVVGQNHKLLIYPLEEMPTLGRGKGVKLQAYREGELSDVKTFKLEDGLTWKWGESRTRTETDLRLWIGKRASAGRLAPQGFPKDDKFD